MNLDIQNKLYYQLKNLINDCVKFEPDNRIEMTKVKSQLEEIKKSVYRRIFYCIIFFQALIFI